MPMYVNLETDASLDVDAQTTFMPAHDGHPAGGLAVKDGHLVMQVIHATWDFFIKKFATRDLHPDGSVSIHDSYVGAAPNSPIFLKEVLGWTAEHHGIAAKASFGLDDLVAYLTAVPGQMQMRWARHGIIDTPEARLHPSLPQHEYRYIQIKGMDPCCDSYSGFRDNLRRPTALTTVLKRHGVRRLFLRGLALDFCVGFTALDAVKEGFEVFVIEDATRSVALPGTVEKMKKDLDAAGVKLIQSSQLRVA